MKILSLFVFACFFTAQAADGRLAAGMNFLSLGGSSTSALKEASGGNPFGDVVQEITRDDIFVKKHVGIVKFDEVEVKVGLGMDKELSAWIQDSFNKQASRKNGSLLACDFNGNGISQRQFFDALITEISFPALDAASKDPGYLTVKMAPERTSISALSGKCSNTIGRQKVWLPSNFRLELDEIDATRVSKIDSFGAKIKVASFTGDARAPQRDAARPDFSNLKVTVSNVGLKTWQDWHDSFLVQGNNGDKFEKSGFIVLLAPDLKTELFRIKLDNVGILKMASTQSSNDAVLKTEIHLYVERMEFVPVK